MTTPTPEQLEAAIAFLAEAERRGGEVEGVASTAEQPLRHANSIWATEICGEESGVHHLKHKGAVLEAEGWDDDAELDLDGFKVNPTTLLGVAN